MINEFIKILILYIPAGFANMAPVLFRKIDFLNYPVDFGLKINNRRFLGDNKTFRGLFFGILISIVSVSIIDLIINDFIYTNYFYGDTIISIFIGFFALLFDMIESFFKRQKGIKPGESFVPFDQLDWVFGSSIVLYVIGKIDVIEIIIAMIVFFLIHIIIKHIGFYLGIENKKW